jgi:hypothetical protein
MSGIMRDDGSPFTSYPTSSNISAVLSSQGFPTSAILSSDSFPLPQDTSSTLRIFNLTSRVATDVMFRCLAQSTAHTATRNRVFKGVYSYEFDRAYQIKEWSPNPPACEAPVTKEYPFGDPNAPCGSPTQPEERLSILKNFTNLFAIQSTSATRASSCPFLAPPSSKGGHREIKMTFRLVSTL